MSNYFLMVFCATVFFTGCYNTNSLEEEKSICLKQNKNFYVTETNGNNNFLYYT